MLGCFLPLALVLASSLSSPESPEAPDLPSLEEASPWSGKMDLGLSFLNGNNTSSSNSLEAELHWEQGESRWLATSKYSGIRQTQANGQANTTSRLHHYGIEYHDMFGKDKRWFVYGKTSARFDEPNGLRLRADLGIGLGYRHEWAEKTWLSIEIGPSAIRETQIGTPREDTFSSRFAMKSVIQLWDEWSWDTKGEFFSSTQESDDQSFTGETGLRWAFREGWYLQSQVSLSWDGTPAAGFGRTDTQYVLSIGTSF